MHLLLSLWCFISYTRHLCSTPTSLSFLLKRSYPYRKLFPLFPPTYMRYFKKWTSLESKKSKDKMIHITWFSNGLPHMHKYINWYIILHLQMSPLSLFIYSIISRQNVQYKLKKLSFIGVKAVLFLFLLHLIFCDFQVRVFGIFIRVVKIGWFTFLLFFP